MNDKETSENKSAPDDFAYVDHVVAFIDLLGFSHAVAIADEIRRNEIISLLRYIMSFNRNSVVENPIYLHDEFVIQSRSFRPAITSFSDSIVISYDVRNIRESYHNSEFWLHEVMSDLTWLLAAFTMHALRVGLLLRGGLAIGRLHHSNRIVFGEALVEAYEIETKTSLFPRIVLSNNFPPSHFTVEDQDGLRRMDNIRLMFMQGLKTPGWYEATVEMIYKMLDELKEYDVALKKWRWFADRFRDLHKGDIPWIPLPRSYGDLPWEKEHAAPEVKEALRNNSWIFG